MIIKIKISLTVHSGPQPVMVSGLGTNFPKQRQIGFPNLFAIHIVPGPHGDGLQGSGFSMHLKFKMCNKNRAKHTSTIIMIS